MARILVLSDLWHPFPGGAESYIRRVTEALHARGHDIHILTSYAKAKSTLPMTIEDIGVYERHQEGVDSIELFAIEYSPDIILTHHFFAGEFKEWLSSLPVPFIEIIHNRPRHPDAAFAIFNSQYTANRSGFREGDMVMLPPVTGECVVKGWSRYMMREGYREYPCLDHSKPFCPECYPPRPFDCIGHIKPLGGKGIDLTYKLAEAMPERKFLILRGEWQDGEDIRHLPNVEFMEPVDDIREFYARCRIVLMPSLSEDAGTVPQECALNGIPCISSDVGGLRESNYGGITIPPDNFWEFHTSIRLLDSSEAYTTVVKDQRAYVASLNFPARFDEIDRKVRALCQTQ